MKLTKRDVGIGLLAGIAGYVIAKNNLIDIQIVRDSSRKTRREVKKNKREEETTDRSYQVWFDSYKKASNVIEEMLNIAKEYGTVSTSEWREICFDNDDENKPISNLNKLKISDKYGWYLKDLDFGSRDSEVDLYKDKINGKDGWTLTLPPAVRF